MNPAQNPDAFLKMFFVIFGGVLVVVLVIAIFFLLTLQRALSRVAPRNRLMEPGMVWLMLIPCFNIIWQFFIVTRVPGSLRNEFRDRNQDDGSDYGKGVGLAYAVLNIVGSCAGNSQQGASPEFAMGGAILSFGLSVLGLILFITIAANSLKGTAGPVIGNASSTTTMTTATVAVVPTPDRQGSHPTLSRKATPATTNSTPSESKTGCFAPSAASTCLRRRQTCAPRRVRSNGSLRFSVRVEVRSD